MTSTEQAAQLYKDAWIDCVSGPQPTQGPNENLRLHLIERVAKLIEESSQSAASGYYERVSILPNFTTQTVDAVPALHAQADDSKW